jgi:GNAT superfamily N-acetyltransferase
MGDALSAADAGYCRGIGDGLVLRWSSPDDTDRLAALLGQAFRDGAGAPPNSFLAGYTRLLMRGDHPFMGPGDFAVVEDESRPGRPLVACTCLWRERWRYEDVPLPIGRPEFVATDLAYRNRGLIRALFEMVHARSRAEGHLVQAITGIFYFYRQFGYEYALDLRGERRVVLSRLPAPAGEPPLRLRPAAVEDLPLIRRLYDQGRRGSMVWNEWSERRWRYNVDAWRADPSLPRRGHVELLVDGDGHPCGLACLAPRREGPALTVWMLELSDRLSWGRTIPAVLRALAEAAERVPVAEPGTAPMTEISLRLGTSHPAYEVVGPEPAPYECRPYAWYVRVPDLPALISRIAPVLEDRLAAAPSAAHFSGELTLDFYRDGLRLAFEQGNLTAAEPWRRPAYDDHSSAAFPPLTFLKLLFGYRGLDELRHMFPDVWVGPEAEPVLRALFPTRRSFVLDV